MLVALTLMGVLATTSRLVSMTETTRDMPFLSWEEALDRLN